MVPGVIPGAPDSQRRNVQTTTTMAKRQQSSEPTTAAKYLKTDTQFTCSICIEHYRNPRYLPTCGHTFCENCLLKYTRNIQIEQDRQVQPPVQGQGGKFECPVCRKSNYLPEADVTMQWVQTFPLNTVIIQMMEAIPRLSEEMKDERKTCDPCKQEGEVTAGLKFCLDCKEVLCKTCSKYHKNFKMSKDHKLIDVTDIPAEKSHLVDFLTEVGKCVEHRERDVEFYCKIHDAIVCSMCLISDHKACEMIDIACHNIDTTKLRNDTELLISRMKETIEHCNFLQNLGTENKNNLKQKLKEIRENIHQVRDRVVELMDNVVGHVSDVTKQMEIEREDGLYDQMARIAKIKKLTAQSVAQLDTIQQHGSEKHKFVSTHLMNKTYFEEIFKQISDEDNGKQLDAEMVLADNLTKLIDFGCTDAEKLVQIKMTESESSHKPLASVLTSSKDTGMVENFLRDCKLIKVEEHTIYPEPKTEYESMQVYKVSTLIDGRVILTDSDVWGRSGHLFVYNAANRTKLELTLTNRASDAVPIDDTHIAVCGGVLNRLNGLITIVTVGNELKVERTLQTQFKPLAIHALNNGKLAVIWRMPLAFSVVDVSGETAVNKLYFCQDTNGRMFKSFNALAVDERRQHVIQSCCVDRVVYCFDFTGRPIFSYVLPKLSFPKGVALDKCGNIYIIDRSKPGSIHKLSPTGDLISIIRDGVPPCPAAICSDATGTGFWVTQDKESWNKVAHFRLL